MERHALLHDRAVAGAQGRRELAPGRRVADADRIADAAVLLDAVPGDHLGPGGGELLAQDAGLHLVEYGSEALGDHLGNPVHALGRLAELDAGRAGRVVAGPNAP